MVAAVRAAGTRIPLTDEVITEVTRASNPGDDHRARVRTAGTLGLPSPVRPPRQAPVTFASPVSPAQLRAARAAARVLAAVGPLPLDTLLAAVTRSRRFRTRTPLSATGLACKARIYLAGFRGAFCAGSKAARNAFVNRHNSVDLHIYLLTFARTPPYSSANPRHLSPRLDNPARTVVGPVGDAEAYPVATRTAPRRRGNPHGPATPRTRRLPDQRMNPVPCRMATTAG